MCKPIGVVDRNRISDARMTASSSYNNDYHPSYGRLNESSGNGGWCPKTNSDRTDYLQVDMGEVRSVCGVATQGIRGSTIWTTSYKLQLSTNSITWNNYKETNIEKVWRELKLTFSAITKNLKSMQIIS